MIHYIGKKNIRRKLMVLLRGCKFTTGKNLTDLASYASDALPLPWNKRRGNKQSSPILEYV
jgi:hypothetical protein